MTARGVIPETERLRLHTASAAVDESTAELKAAVRAARAAGGSVRAIAAELGKSTRTIQDWLAGVERSGYGKLVGRLRPEIEQDPSFAVRLIREAVLDARSLRAQSELDAFHADPGSTGSPNWDAVVAGVAMMTGLDRVSDPAILRWCDALDRAGADLFDPLDVGAEYRWLDYLRTPIELRVRNVILASGNLEGV